MKAKTVKSATFSVKELQKFKVRAKSEEVQLLWKEKGHKGFYARIYPSGLVSFFVNYRDKETKERHYMTIGSWKDPVTGAGQYTLEEAHGKEREALNIKAAGRNPAIEKKTGLVKAVKTLTVKELADRWLKTRVAEINGGVKDGGKEDRRVLDKDVLPVIGPMSLKQVTYEDIEAVLQRIIDRGSLILANRTLSKMHTMFEYALDKRLLELNPCSRVKKPGREGKRQRFLTVPEVQLVWNKLDEASSDLCMDAKTKRILKLVLVTGQRPGEVSGMHSDEISGRIWTIPGDVDAEGRRTWGRTKTGYESVVYLSDLALELIGDKKGYIFDSCQYGKPTGQGMTSSTVATAVWRNLGLGPNVGFGVNRFGTEGKPWTPHDLRRTAATLMVSKVGIQGDVADAILNHKQSGIRPIYIIATPEDKKDAWERWASYLSEITTAKPTTPAKVIPIGQRKAA
jgi:integrase